MNDPTNYYHFLTVPTRESLHQKHRRYALDHADSVGGNSGISYRSPQNTRIDRQKLRTRQVNFFRKSTVKAFKRLGQSIAILVAITLLILMTVATWKGSAMTNDYGLAAFTMILVSTLLFSFAYLTASYISNKSFVFLVIVLLVIALLKIILILNYKLGPASDYWTYHYLAYARASGIPWTTSLVGMNSSWPHVLNIALLYSIPYSLIGTSYITAQIINITLTFFDALLIYKLCASIINKQAGIFSALIFSLIPSYFLYSLLNGAEPMFMTFVLGMLVCFDTFMKRAEFTPNIRWFTSVVSLFILAVLAYMVRPTIAIWLVAGLLFLIFRQDTKPVNTNLRFKWYLFYLAFFAAFFLFSALSSNIYSLLYHLPIGTSSSMDRYSLATGTSSMTNGAFNEKIYKIMNKNHHRYPDVKERNQHIDKDLNQQIYQHVDQLNDTHHWGIFLDQKYTQFSSESYGYDWLLYNSSRKNIHSKTYYHLRTPLVVLSTIFFEFVLVLCIITLSVILLFSPILRKSTDILNKLFYFALLLDGFILGSMIFEV